MKLKLTRKVILLFIMLITNIAIAQTEQNANMVYVVGDEIVSIEKVEEYMKNGYIKLIHNGVSDQEFAKLKSKHGDKLLAKEFILLIEIHTDEELKAIKSDKNQSVGGNSKVKKEKTVTTEAHAAANEFILNIGDEAKDFTVKMINGEAITLSSLKGKVVLINFWATWCAPCIREFYEIPSKILNEFKDEDFVFLPIAIGEGKEKVIKKMNSLKEDGIDFNSGIDPEKSIWNQYAKGSIPKNLIIDSNGKVVLTLSGNNGKSVESLQKFIKEMLEK